MANVLEKEMYSYFIRLNEAEKKSVVEMLKTFLQGRTEDTGRISIEQYNKEIDEAMEEVAAGNYITQEEMEKLAAKW
jgi:uncharacterized protein YdbL (DUF1318 family)